MTRFLVFVLLTAITALGTELTNPPADQSPQITFNKDVLPVLQKNCQVCHRPGGVAPMSFLTYESTRPWAKAIKAAVINKKMPPWFADPHVGEFRNAPKLTAADVNTLAGWADRGAFEGNPADKPPAPKWAQGWRIQPDVVVSMPQPYRVAAKGAGEIKEFFIENPFTEDTWVSAIEIRPGDPSVVHHVIVQIPENPFPGNRAVANTLALTGGKASVTVCGNCKDEAPAKPATNKQAAEQAILVREMEAAAAKAQALAFASTANRVRVNGRGQNGGAYSDIIVRLREKETGRGAFTTMEAVYAPGTQPLDFQYRDSAKLIRGGQPIRIEVHYTPNGKVTSDQTKVALTLAKAPAQRRFIMMAPEHLVDSRKPIPPGESNWETKGELTFTQDAELVWFMPHMHLRGKDMTFRLVYPDGREETVLSARFNFNWQLGYEVKKPIKVPRNTKMIVTAHHDNSANNPMNPAPTQTAAWGEMTSQEMMLPWFGVLVDRDAKPEMIALYKPPDLDAIPALNRNQVGEKVIIKPGPNPPPPVRVVK